MPRRLPAREISRPIGIPDGTETISPVNPLREQRFPKLGRGAAQSGNSVNLSL